MLGLPGPDEYVIAVSGYTSDLGGKNLQSEWYAITVPNPDPDPDPDPDLYSDYLSSIAERKFYLSSSAKGKQKVKIGLPLGTIETEPLHSFLKDRMMYPSTQHAFLDDMDDMDTGSIETELLHPFSKVRMMYQSTQHALLGDLDTGSSYLYSLGGLDPVGSDSDGDGAHPFEPERCRKVLSLHVTKLADLVADWDADWRAVPLMTFPNRYNPQSVALNRKLYVLGGFSRSQFPAKAASEGVGWLESYTPPCYPWLESDILMQPFYPYFGWESLPNPPSGFSFNDDPLIFTTLEGNFEEKILIAQYNHLDKKCDSATFYVYDPRKRHWTTLEPPVRKLLARYPDRTGRRSVAVGNTLYWGLFEDEDINVQAYDLNKDIWFHGSCNIRCFLRKDEFLADNVFPASPPLLHLANQSFCLFLLTSIYDEKNCEVSNLCLNCLVLDVSPINDEGDNHQHDYYDHVCYKVRGDVNFDDKEDNASYDVHPHDHFWRLSISILSIHKYPLVNPIQLLDAVVLKRPLSRSMRRLKSKSVIPYR